MKRLILIACSLCLISLTNAQVVTRETPVKKNVIIKPAATPPPAPAPAPATKTSPPSQPQQPAQQAPTPVYSLTAVKVTIKTGTDNKEFPSVLGLTVLDKNGNTPLYGLPGNGIKNELAVNSVMDFGLQTDGMRPTAEALRLETIQRTGISLKIYYGPNFFMDAWKIEGVSLTLEFKDQNNNLHPTLGSKTIVFNTAKGFLNNTYHTMRCLADGNFTALTSPISEY